MPSRRALLATAAAMAWTPITAPALAGCASTRRTVRGRPLVKVTYVTGIGVPGREDYVHVAKERGYYEGAGFDVDIQPGTAGDENRKAVASGAAQFAAVETTSQIIAQGRVDTGTILVSAVQQRTLVAFMVDQDGPIVGPRDLVGHKLAAVAGSAPKSLFPAYAKEAGIDPAAVTVEEVPAAQLLPQYRLRRYDGIGQFTPGVPTVETAIGRLVRVLPFSDVMRDLFGNAIIAGAGYVKKHPAEVKAFVHATLRGLVDAVTQPAEAARQIEHATEGLTKASLAEQELRLMAPYVDIANPGVIDAGRLARAIGIVEALGLIASGGTDGIDPRKFAAIDLAAWAN